MNHALTIEVGLKTDAVTYRYSYSWLFALMERHGLRKAQLGTFFELYHLPNQWFVALREEAAAHNIAITSVFASHRELGGFFREEPGMHEAAYRNFARLIEVGGLVGASCVGGPPGTVLRDSMDSKNAGVQRYLTGMKRLLHHAWVHGVDTVTIAPMACMAEPPTMPEEIRHFADTLSEYHQNTPETAAIGICLNTAHGYADAEGISRVKPVQMIEAAAPWLAELHLQNTDDMYCSTFGFSDVDRVRGIIDLAAVRESLRRFEHKAPREHLMAYLAIDGPTLGRDYSDKLVEQELDASIEYALSVFGTESAAPATEGASRSRADRVLGPAPLPAPDADVFVAPSLVYANQQHLEASVRALELSGADYLHCDIIDGHFAPNMPMGMETLRQLRGITDLPFDVHLMTEHNDALIRQMSELGADLVTVHVESCSHLDRALALIRALGMRAGAALNPATPLQVLDYILERLDLVLIMTVNPGFAGQRLTPAAIRKIEACRAYLEARDVAIPIQVEGNVSFDNIPAQVAAGADILVADAGSLYSSNASIPDNMTRIRALSAQGLDARKPRGTA